MKTNNGLIFDENDLSSPDIDNAGFHNSIYRGKDITSYLTDGSLWTRISSGKFTNLFIGDYFNVTLNGNIYKMEIAAFDRFYNYRSVTKHHVVIIPETAFEEEAEMNVNATTDGGYANCDMHMITLPKWAGYLETALGANHVLQTSEPFTSSVDANAKNVMRPDLTGASNDYTWKTQKAVLLSETEVCGYLSGGSSGYECIMCNSNQLPLFRLNPSKILVEVPPYVYWLRTISSNNYFCTVNSGVISSSRANNDNGVRPRFVIG